MTEGKEQETKVSNSDKKIWSIFCKIDLIDLRLLLNV